MEILENNLFQLGLVDRVLNKKELNSLARGNKTIPIMMGQTFDGGQPVDMVKYGLFIMELEDCLKESGASPSSQWLLADHFMTSINGEKDWAENLFQRNLRQKFLERMNEVYHGRIGVVYSSELVNRKEYQQILLHLQKELESNPQFRQEMLSSIPADRRNKPEALRYPLEELATIFSLGTQIKVGPKYEVNYDVPARNMAADLGFPKYVAVHLTNSFPLGNPVIPMDDKIEIESVGLTPYKMNSKKLGKYRLDPLNMNPSDEKDLILQAQDFRAIKDLIFLSLVAGKRLRGEFCPNISDNLVDSYDTRAMAYEFYNKYVKSPLMGKK